MSRFVLDDIAGVRLVAVKGKKATEGVRSVAAKGDADNPHAVCRAALGECSTEECDCPQCRELREYGDKGGICKQGERSDLTGCFPATKDIAATADKMAAPQHGLSDPLDISTDNVQRVWELNRNAILNTDSKLSPAMAGNLAAARILNGVDRRAAEYRKAIDAKVDRGEPISDEEESKYIHAEDARKKLYVKLVQLSGYRPHETVDDHPAAKEPIVSRGQDGQDRRVKAREIAKRREELYAHNIQQIGDAKIVHLQSDYDEGGLSNIIVSPSTKRSGKWQVSWLDASMTPFGDNQFDSREDAIASALGKSVSGRAPIGNGHHKVVQAIGKSDTKESLRECGGKGGNPGPCPEPGASTSSAPDVKTGRAGAVQAILGKAKMTADDMKAVAARVGGAAFDRLPPRAQQALATSWKVAKAIEHKAMVGFAKGKELAVAVAKERGLDPAHAERVGRIIGIADQAFTWSGTTFAAGVAVTGSVTAGKLAAYVPVASLAYVAYSTARNPFATVRAARSVLRRKTAHEGLEGLFLETEGMDHQGAAAHLLQRLADAGDSAEWYSALVYVALDETQGDLAAAIALADEAFAGQGEEPVAEAEDDNAGDEPEEDPVERAEHMADILLAIYGDRALDMIGDAGEDDEDNDVAEGLDHAILEAGFTGVITDKIGRKLHYVDGKRVKAPATAAAKPKKASKEETYAAAKDKVAAALKGPKTPEAARDLANHLSTLTVAQLGTLKKEFGLKASGKTKAALVAKIADRLQVHQQAQAKPAVKAPVSKQPRPSFVTTDSNPDLPDGSRAYLDTSSPEELKALHDYTGGHAFQVNAALRTSELPRSESLKQEHEQLQQLFAKNPDLPKPVTVHRGMSMSPDAAEQFVAGLRASAEKGEPFRSAGYVSTTTNRADVESAPIKMTIKAINGVDTTPLTQGYKAEKELLLNAGTEYKIGKITKTERGYHVELEQLPSERKKAKTNKPTPTKAKSAKSKDKAEPAAGTTGGLHPAHDSPEAPQHLANTLAELDQDKGGHNFLHLADLRKEYPGWSKEQFDSAMNNARRAGLITLSGAEGRHGISDTDQAAGIKNDSGGSMLLYASLKKTPAKSAAKTPVAVEPEKPFGKLPKPKLSVPQGHTVAHEDKAQGILVTKDDKGNLYTHIDPEHAKTAAAALQEPIFSAISANQRQTGNADLRDVVASVVARNSDATEGDVRAAITHLMKDRSTGISGHVYNEVHQLSAKERPISPLWLPHVSGDTAPYMFFTARKPS